MGTRVPDVADVKHSSGNQINFLRKLALKLAVTEVIGNKNCNFLLQLTATKNKFVVN
jgi:hypothetical protein